MNTLEQAWEGKMKSKWKMEKLDTSPEPQRLGVQMKPAEYYQNYLKSLKTRWGIDSLAVEGVTLSEQFTLADAVREHNVLEQRKFKTAIANADYQGKKVRLWLDIAL